MATPLGSTRPACAAGPPSPEDDFEPSPATVVMMPVRASTRAHAAIQAVGEVEVALAVEGEAVRLVQVSPGGGAAVAGEALGAVAGDRGDHLGPGIDPADAVVVGVGEGQVARAVEGDVEGRVERGLGGGSPVSGEARPPGADRAGDRRGLPQQDHRQQDLGKRHRADAPGMRSRCDGDDSGQPT